ncbi:MAG: hypothetical protein IT371_19960 [Deltaproteobacteria bacterium]|nr:hypothetical protein [Deltaproteobacteria bacterium]
MTAHGTSRPGGVVITAAAALAPIGFGLAEFKRGLRRSEHRLGEVTLFSEEPEAKGLRGGELTGFDPKAIMAAKGLRYMDRNTLIILSCMKLDLETVLAQLGEREQVGFTIGTTYGSLRSQIDFPVTYLTQGFKALNAMDFPNMVINAPPSQGNIWWELPHSSTTISNAFTAGVDAVVFATDMIRTGQARQMIAGGSDEFSLHTALAFARRGLASASGQVRPFDARHDGTLLGEGAAMVLLEERAIAEQRGASIRAEVLGSGSTFDGRSEFAFHPEGEGAAHAMQLALEEAGITADQVDFIAASANGSPEGDRMEARAIERVFGARGRQVPVVAYKSYVGECFGATGAMQIVAALCDLEDGIISATCGYGSGSEGLNVTRTPVTGASPKVVMVNSFGYTGHNSSLILRKA